MQVAISRETRQEISHILREPFNDANYADAAAALARWAATVKTDVTRPTPCAL